MSAPRQSVRPASEPSAFTRPLPTRPRLERPSLFASNDDLGALDDVQPVRILSTLESVQTRARPAPARQRRRTSRWQMRTLTALMAVGVLALLAGFAMVVSQSGAGGPPSHALEPRVGTSGTTSIPAVAASTHPSLADAPGAATIETLPPTAAGHPAPPPTAASEAEPVAALPTAQATPVPAEGGSLAAPPRPQPAHAPAGTHTTDADVALLEAMFSHAPRPVAPAGTSR